METCVDTKQKILDAALTLFSEKGYSAVRVAEIADAVGIKAPSLYKHFKGKQEIFDSCVDEFSERMEGVRNELRLPGTRHAAVEYAAISEEEVVAIAIKLFSFYLEDEIAAKFRKMLMMERYLDPKLNELFDTFFISGAVDYEERVFSSLMDANVIRKDDPHVIALRFYSPIFYLLQKYDTLPDETESAKQELASMVREFCRTYRV
jgi:AcrR family transcriptional regulator